MLCVLEAIGIAVVLILAVAGFFLGLFWLMNWCDDHNCMWVMAVVALLIFVAAIAPGVYSVLPCSHG